MSSSVGPCCRRWLSVSAPRSSRTRCCGCCSRRRCRVGHSAFDVMESVFDSLALGFAVAFRPDVLFYAFLGCLVGTLVGMLPGIGPLAGISILLPVTFGLDATKAIVMLAGIYYGSQYGGSTTSILMRIPGEAASV